MYQAINTILEKYRAAIDAAEAHGMASGMLCIARQTDVGNWFRVLFESEEPLLDEDADLLAQLFERTRQLLDPEAGDFEFDLLLPDEDEPLFEQIEALKNWCQGFLFGVGYNQGGSSWSGDSAEIMRDVIEFTKLDSDADGDEDESALTEIREYLRAAVLMVRDQFLDQSQANLH
ncbi:MULTISPECIES: UPF0149 family protein [Methylomonas]|uniref:UPF0149 family protein n=1 Tax=Methylomonas TaxID=416 RepID=UPI001231FAAE|nr:UPF0149 family protein [Methylomonas rhizoryzae]